MYFKYNLLLIKKKKLNKKNQVQYQSKCADGYKHAFKGAITVWRALFIRQQLTLTSKRSLYSLFLTNFRCIYAIHKKCFSCDVNENKTKLLKYLSGVERGKIGFRITLELIKRAQIMVIIW